MGENVSIWASLINILLILVVIFIVCILIYFFWRMKDKMLGNNSRYFENIRTFRDQSASSEPISQQSILNEINKIKSRLTNLENALKSAGDNNILSDSVAPRDITQFSNRLNASLVDFFKSQANAYNSFVEQYKLYLKKGNIHLAPTHKIQRNYKKINTDIRSEEKTQNRSAKKSMDVSELLRWWGNEAHNKLNSCKDSLKNVFGEVQVENIHDNNEDWKIIAVTSDSQKFFLLPRRKGYFENKYFHDWFSLEGSENMREGATIEEVVLPLPIAQKNRSGDWVLISQKGKVRTIV